MTTEIVGRSSAVTAAAAVGTARVSASIVGIDS
jgi:hypothetical protein